MSCRYSAITPARRRIGRCSSRRRMTFKASTADKTKHCPGPWRVVERKNARGQELTPCVVGKRSWGGTRDWPIAIASAISRDETDANARLIAAAPDLLEALETLTKAVFDSGLTADTTNA